MNVTNDIFFMSESALVQLFSLIFVPLKPNCFNVSENTTAYLNCSCESKILTCNTMPYTRDPQEIRTVFCSIEKKSNYL